MENNALKVPTNQSLPADEEKQLPYVIVGDDAFPLKSYLMKPYPHRQLLREQRIFNYRLSRARRVVENAFGILANRFRVFLTTIPLSPVNAEKIIFASCVLHNYLREKSQARYIPPGFIDSESNEGILKEGDWRSQQTLSGLEQQGSNTYSKDVKQVRDEFCLYFNEKGQVPWQSNCI